MFISESTLRVSTARLLPPQCVMGKINDKADRLYQAARATGRLDSAMEQSSLARLLNVAPQNVNNWESRGVSKDAAIEAQRVLGISATWVLYGIEPMMVRDGAASTTGPLQVEGSWPFSVPFDAYETLEDTKKHELDLIVKAFIAGATPTKSQNHAA